MAPCALVVLIAVLSLAPQVHAWPPKNGGGWADVSVEVGMGVNSGFRVAALLDWNNDKSIDLLAIDSTNTTVFVNLWRDSNSSFAPYLTFSQPNTKWVSAAVADLNRDGTMDAVLQGYDIRNNVAMLCLLLNEGIKSDIDCAPFAGFQPPKAATVSVLDVSGICGSIDVVTTLANGSFVVFRNALSNPDRCNFIGGVPVFTPFVYSNAATAPYLAGTGYAMDLNGDCTPEIITAAIDDTDDNQVRYTSRADGTLWDQTLQEWTVPRYVGLLSWLDIDADGAMDAVYPSCMSPVLRNGYLTCQGRFDSLLFVMNNIGGSSVCSRESCCKGHPSSFASVTNASEIGSGYAHLPLSALGCGKAGDVYMPSSAEFPAVIRSLDFNRDRYMDSLIATNVGSLLLVRNDQGSIGYRCDAVGSGTPASSIPYFFDLNADGRVDILVTTTDGDGNWALWNGLTMEDDYYLMVTTLNGVKGNGIPYPAWGAAQVGAVHRFMWQDIYLNNRYASNTQFSMSSGHALQMPHVHFGLGRTFSYVQNYATGMMIRNYKNWHQWPVYLIPNSQAVVMPYPITDTSEWEIRLFLPTSRFKQLIMIALIVTLSVIGIPIAYLRYREIQQDKKEAQQMH